MHTFPVHSRKNATPETPPRRRWRWWAALALLVLGGIVWAARPDPHMARAKELQNELFGSAGKNLSAEERKARFTEYREQVKHLNADQKWELSAPARERQKAEMERYFALSPKEKIKYLDGLIDRAEKSRKGREQKAAQGGAGRPGGGGLGGGFGGPGGAQKGGAPGGAPGKAPRSPEEIEKRRKEALARTTPEERARADQFRKEMNDRRKQRGLSVRL
ncbi:Putative uncharacterized protein OS=uncultured planctomycete GN=HGMM_F07G10C03 PE=4 SV=1 [Gemmata massiliana]|uniref:Uncharacterized protein n=1 Tax=Gemmata massiliana TaxID=1210884 RepID=A0A6P2CZ73_9BACT|nr:hypothetical protein [Gemmata massiliana]VTR94428.1 Putative uncharacterized protein OS=uncultured planctomycete GN=HGMM_F07G10C03 PE=4 SV=1 [Gemmata massiliana]